MAASIRRGLCQNHKVLRSPGGRRFISSTLSRKTPRRTELLLPAFNSKAASFSSFQVQGKTGQEFGSQHLTPGLGRMTSLVFESGSGVWITDVEGQEYLDFTAGIGVTNLGHCHPRITAAVQEQVGKLVHGQVNIGHHANYLRLVEKLIQVTPEGLDTFFLCSTGAEAVENAIKIARMTTNKPNVIVMQGGYHGRTMGTMALTTSKTIYRERFGPLIPGVFVLPFPYAAQLPAAIRDRPEDMTAFCLESLHLMLKQQTTAAETAALLIEPVLGEGGYVPAPAAFLEGLQSICKDNGILLIADEIQSGFGRTGDWFASTGMQLKPDILTMAKGLANGFPLAGVATHMEHVATQAPGSMGGTYAGNAVACAAALAVIDVIKDENVLDNVKQRGKQLERGLERLQQELGLPFLEVRGKGLMIGVEFDTSDPARCTPGIAARLSKACEAEKMLLLTASVFDTMRFAPALTITEAEMDEALTRLKRALQNVAWR